MRKNTHREADEVHVAAQLASDATDLLTIAMVANGIVMASLPPGDDGRKELSNVRDALRCTTWLLRMVADLGSEPSQTREALDVNEVLDEHRRVLEIVLGHQARLQLDLRRGPCRVYAAPLEIARMAYHLLKFARDTVFPGGVISLRTGLRQLEPDDADALGLKAGSHVTVRALAAMAPGAMPPAGASVQDAAVSVAALRRLASRCGGALREWSPTTAGSGLVVYLPQG